MSESGNTSQHFNDTTSYYFLTGLLSLILIPWTIYYLHKLKNIKPKVTSRPFKCNCSICTDPTKVKKKVLSLF